MSVTPTCLHAGACKTLSHWKKLEESGMPGPDFAVLRNTLIALTDHILGFLVGIFSLRRHFLFRLLSTAYIPIRNSRTVPRPRVRKFESNG